MGQGFFSKTELAMYDAPVERVPRCGACKLYLGCESPKMKVAGKGKKKVLIIGEAPGEHEDERGKPFVGKSGQRLQTELANIGINLFEDCWVTNSLICRPPENAKPTPKQIDYCRPNIVNAIERFRPKLIILLGAVPVTSVISWLWKKEPGGITRWAGFRIPCRQIQAWVCPTFHPSYILREENEALDLIFHNHLRQAFKCLERKRPESNFDLTARVTIFYDAKRAAQALSSFALHCARRGGVFAYDYETNMLKPDVKRALIVCCSVSDGETTLAFPWYGAVTKVMANMLRSKKYQKIAANIQFEDRWTRAKLGIDVANWKDDTVLAAHCLDNRKNISGVKFQAFARLGYKQYDQHVAKYLKSKTNAGYAENRIKQCNLKDLLIYNGIDSLVEYELASLQDHEIGD